MPSIATGPGNILAADLIGLVYLRASLGSGMSHAKESGGMHYDRNRWI